MGLKDKASKIDFASLMPTPALNPEVAKPKTAPGAMMALANDQRSELLRENDLLRERAAKTGELEGRLQSAVEELQSWDGAKATRLLDPKTIQRSVYANRHESSFKSEAFETLKREIKEAGGNVQPIKVRALANPGDGPQFEIVFGHRRHEACSQLGLPVLAFVDNLDDQALFEEMERENRERADLSAWEQGVMYAKALDRGLYPSIRQLATAIGVDPTNLSKALVLARLPAKVLEAFASPLDLQFRWSTVFKAAIENDLAGLESRAVKISAKRDGMSPKEIFAGLTTPQESRVQVQAPATVQAFEKAGKTVATMKTDGEGRSVIRIHVGLTAQRQRELAQLLERFVAAG
ncbi:chromosome partitioning protein, ParB family [Variovorax sp. HW608]|uniref:ParB/RepB/Spo0J family partition protein n=1 Tax=Variovorax sp. HW608 TaxID=1034889 RepID=UPI00081FE4A7|nr:ParB/RepB/Spo0J family partition protein [Variovorax sp. HW608]SCK09345.1 chromosome partitioning protein, ParB family [Variovorax sp. HW608]